MREFRQQKLVQKVAKLTWAMENKRDTRLKVQKYISQKSSIQSLKDVRTHSSSLVRSASFGDLRHHGRAQIQDLDVFAGPVQQPALVHGQLLADQRLLAVGQIVAGDNTIVDLNRSWQFIRAGTGLGPNPWAWAQLWAHSKYSLGSIKPRLLKFSKPGLKIYSQFTFQCYNLWPKQARRLSSSKPKANPSSKTKTRLSSRPDIFWPVLALQFFIFQNLKSKTWNHWHRLPCSWCLHFWD